jgi:hypothetical protein
VASRTSPIQRLTIAVSLPCFRVDRAKCAGTANSRKETGPLDHTHIYITLAGALAKRGIAPAGIEDYGQLWDSLTSVARLPCPLCFTYAGKRSALRPLPHRAGKEPMRCDACQAVFCSPIPV